MSEEETKCRNCEKPISWGMMLAKSGGPFELSPHIMVINYNAGGAQEVRTYCQECNSTWRREDYMKEQLQDRAQRRCEIFPYEDIDRMRLKTRECPFCGRNPIIFSGDYNSWVIECSECEIIFASDLYDPDNPEDIKQKMSELVKLWNG